jgi:DNA helicase-2/ATP-dependent DNA helicase PcrA
LRFGTVSERLPSRFLDEIPAELARVPALREWLPSRGSGRGRGYRTHVPPTIDYSYSQVDEGFSYAPGTFSPANGMAHGTGGGDQLRAGMRVNHPTFGIGIVRRSEGRGDTEKVSVQFAHGGMRKLIRRFANLEVI